MDKNLLPNIFMPSQCLAGEEVKAYLDGSISEEGRRRVENHLLDCPLCSDAVEGFELVDTAEVGMVEDFSSFKS